MKSRTQVEDEVKRIFEEQFGGEILDWQKSWADYNFSSIQLVYFLKELEEVFGPIPIEKFYDLNNGKELVDYLLNRFET